LPSAFFGIATLILHHRWRQEGRRDAAVLGPLALLLGLLSNEGAVAACAYLFAYALFIDKGTPRRRALSLAPYVVTVVAWRIYYQLQGYGAWASEAYIDPLASPLKFIEAVALREPLYFLSQWLFPPADMSPLVSSSVMALWWLFAMGFAAVFFTILFPLLKRDATARFWCAGMVLSLIPSCATFPADRMLLYSGIGGAALLSQFLVALYAGHLLPPKARIRRIIAYALFLLFIVVHIVLAPAGLPIRIAGTTQVLNNTITEPIRALAEKEELSGKLVVVVNNTLLTGAYFSAMRAVSGLDPAEQVLVLGPVFSIADTLKLSRESANTLVLEIEGGYEWLLCRDSAHPFAVGDEVDLNRVTVEIRQITDDGRPTEVAFRFDTPLEDDSIAWFAYALSASGPTSALEPFEPPPVGMTSKI
jgi:hypothetical protein